MSFKNKVVIVTGASAGIGAAIAINFVKEGADVVLVGRNEVNLKNVYENCEKHGNKPLVVKADVSIDKEAKKIVEKTIEKYGKIDILINNAGFMRYGSIEDGKLIESFDEMIGTNVRGAMLLTTYTTPYLKKTKGNIVNISSIAGMCNPSMLEFLPYSVTKAALNHFSRGAALELSKYGIRVNTICPGPVDTSFLENSKIGETVWSNVLPFNPPLGRVGEAQEISDLVLFVASDKAKSITGSNYVSDNGTLLIM